MAVIPKSNNQGRLKQNLDVVTGWDLGREEVEAIGGLNRNLRFNDLLNVSGGFFVDCVCELALMSGVVWRSAADLCLEIGRYDCVGAGRLCVFGLMTGLAGLFIIKSCIHMQEM